VKLSPRVGQRLEQARERLGLAEEPEAAPPPDAQGSRPRAVFAGVLDGRHLWLAVEATPGTLSLRELGDGQPGQVIALSSDLVEDDPHFRSVRADLADLPGPAESRYEVVMTSPGDRVERVWTPALAPQEPLTTPPADGVQWQVGRSADGTLELTRTPAEPGAVLVGIEADLDDADETVTLHIAGAGPDDELRLVDDKDGAVLVTRPLTHADGVATATLRPDDVPDRVGLFTTVHVGELPVRRRANELARPDTAVLLPQHQSDDGQSMALVYRWLPDGVLRVRRPKAGTP
jgi:hypothetical protein